MQVYHQETYMLVVRRTNSSTCPFCQSPWTTLSTYLRRDSSSLLPETTIIKSIP